MPKAAVWRTETWDEGRAVCRGTYRRREELLFYLVCLYNQRSPQVGSSGNLGEGPKDNTSMDHFPHGAVARQPNDTIHI